MKLVTREQALKHIRADQSDDADDLELKIEAASEAVAAYVGPSYMDQFTDSQGEPFVDSAGDPVGLPRRLQQATLVTIAEMYRERDGSKEYAVPEANGYGYPLPLGATALLFSLRRRKVF